MKPQIAIFPIFLSTAILLSCGGNPKDANLSQAYEYHKSSIEVRERIGETLKGMEPNVPNFEAWEERLHEWDESFVEVPGYGHDHHHEEDEHHHHHHNPPPNLSSKEHLNLQKGLLQEILALEKDMPKR